MVFSGSLGNKPEGGVKRAALGGILLRMSKKPLAMNDSLLASEKYCQDLVRQRDEDRWLAVQYSSADAQGGLIALYAMHQEIRRIPSAVSEPPLGEIRLQWWREALDEIIAGEKVRAHPVVEYAASLKLVTEENRALIEQAIDARAHLLYGEPFYSAEAMLNWFDQSEGFLAAARLATGHDFSEEKLAHLIRAESAFVLANGGEGVAPDLVEEALVLAMPSIEAAASILKNLSAEQSTPHLHLSLVKSRTGKKSGPLTPVTTRLRLFTTMLTGRF